MCLLAAIIFTALQSAQAKEVELLTGWANKYSSLYCNMTALVKVKNLGFNKKIKFHALLTNGEWGDLEGDDYYQTVRCNYVYTAADGDEIWSISVWKNGLNQGAYYAGEFVIKYEVNGQTYWDNNNGKNYHVGHGIKNKDFYVCYIAKDCNVIQSASHRYQRFNKEKNEDEVISYIHVRTKDIGNSKKVKIVYTTDNWQTTKITLAKRSTLPYDNYSDLHWENEMILTVEENENFEYAIAFEVDGDTFWDNNYGMNYSSKIPNY